MCSRCWPSPPSHQGTDALGELVTRLILSGLAAGQDTLFVFTPPQNAPSFEALNFRLLVAHGQAALLEHGPGLPAYLAEHAAQITPGRNGAVVINGNPFTLGHLHLVERAAAQVDRLYLFVVREDRSVFPFAGALPAGPGGHRPPGQRDRAGHLPLRGERGHLPVLLPEAPGRPGRGPDADRSAPVRPAIAPAFHVAARFVGEEPLCPTTAAYNRMMAEVLGGARHRPGGGAPDARRGACPSAPPGCARPSGPATSLAWSSWCPRPPWPSCARSRPSHLEPSWRRPSLCESAARPVRARCSPAT